LTPGRVVTEVTRSGIGSHTDRACTVTTRPQPRARMPGSVRCSSRKAAMTDISKASRRSCSEMASNPPRLGEPPMETRMSTPPCCRSAASTSASMSAAEVRSGGMAVT